MPHEPFEGIETVRRMHDHYGGLIRAVLETSSETPSVRRASVAHIARIGIKAAGIAGAADFGSDRRKAERTTTPRFGGRRKGEQGQVGERRLNLFVKDISLAAEQKMLDDFREILLKRVENDETLRLRVGSLVKDLHLAGEDLALEFKRRLLLPGVRENNPYVALEDALVAAYTRAVRKRLDFAVYSHILSAPPRQRTG